MMLWGVEVSKMIDLFIHYKWQRTTENNGLATEPL